MHYIIPNLLNLINKFSVIPKWELLDWIYTDVLDYDAIDTNENAINILKKKYKILFSGKEKIDYSLLSKNSNAIKIIKKCKKYNNKNGHNYIQDYDHVLFENKNAVKIKNKFLYIFKQKYYFHQFHAIDLQYIISNTNKSVIKYILCNKKINTFEECVLHSLLLNPSMNKKSIFNNTSIQANPSMVNFIDLNNLDYKVLSENYNARDLLIPEIMKFKTL